MNKETTMLYAIKIALRTLKNNSIHTAISILGLTLGLASCMLIAAVVMDELSYDKQWKRSSDIYRLVSIDQREGLFEQKNGAAYAGLAPELKHNFAEVEEYSTLYVSPINLLFDKEDSHSVHLNALHTDSAVHRLLDIKLLQGDDLIPTSDINPIMISKKLADAHFKNTNPIGKTIYDLPRYEDKSNAYVIVGVMEDLPVNSHLRAEVVLLNRRTESELRKDDSGVYARHYILVSPGTNIPQLEQNINSWYADYATDIKTPTKYELQSIQDSYLKSDFGAYQMIKGNIQYIYIFTGVGFMILLIACINFVNLSTAITSSRLKETGVRKILGASKKQLIRQFLLESLLTFGFAAIIAIGLYTIGLPIAQQFIGHPLAADSTTSWKFYSIIISAVLLISLLSGLYPAWFISNFNTDNALGNTIKKSKSNKSPLRSVLVTTQFSLSILVLIALFVVHNQVNFMKNKDTGVDTNGLISIDHISFDNKLEAFRDKLAEQPDILSHSVSSWLPTQGAGYMSSIINDPKNPGQKISIWYIAGDPNLAETLGLKLQTGRFLKSDMATDFIDANDLEAEENAIRPCIVTASTAQALDIQSLDTALPEKNELIPVGVVNDFNSESLHKAMVPTCIVGYSNPQYGAILIRTIPQAEEKVIKRITQLWKDFYPEKQLEAAIVKETISAQYQAEEKIEQLFRGFSILILFLAVLGLLGLIINSVSLRTKEIGIRKVLGASVANITAMLSKDFVKLILLAFVIASPIAWWAMNKWLEDFAYRIDITWWIFVAAGLVALSVALVTVSWQAIKAARANPVDSLRDE